MLWTLANCLPAGGQIGNLTDAWIKLHDFLKADYAAIIDRCIRRADKLPAMIVFIVGGEEDGLGAIKHLSHRESGAIPRLVKGPIVGRRISHGEPYEKLSG